jgi:hypothetical protein
VLPVKGTEQNGLEDPARVSRHAARSLGIKTARPSRLALGCKEMRTWNG